MSRTMVTTFFPALYEHIWKPFLPAVFYKLFPDDVAELCPEQTVNISISSLSTDSDTGSTITVRSPFLALYAIAGIMIGFGWATRLFFIAPNGCNNSSIGDKHNEDTHFYWIVAFLSFGSMNLNGVFLHCLIPYPHLTGKYPVEQPFLWLGDTYSTGVFGVALCAASLAESVHSCCRRWGQRETRMNAALKLIQYGWVLGNLVGVAAVLFYWSNHFDNKGDLAGSSIASLPLELWYLVPTTMFASWGLLLMLYFNFSTDLAIFYGISQVFFSLATLDPIACRRLGQGRHFDLLQQPALMFAGTDAVFLGIGVWLNQRHSDRRRSLRQKEETKATQKSKRH